MRAWLFIAAAVATLCFSGIAVRSLAYGDLHPLHALLSLFFALNFVASLWEICLYFRRDYIERRVDFWREQRERRQRSSAILFLQQPVTTRNAFSMTFWADIWASYSLYDGSYADRRTFGFTCDIANGFVTPLPSLVLYATFTIPFLPPAVAGALGAMLFWQWVYVTSGYWASFFVSGRHRRLGLMEAVLHVHAANSLWVLLPLVGLYVSLRLILDGNYGVLGLG